jgi:hypothetical protein
MLNVLGQYDWVKRTSDLKKKEYSFVGLYHWVKRTSAKEKKKFLKKGHLVVKATR